MINKLHEKVSATQALISKKVVSKLILLFVFEI